MLKTHKKAVILSNLLILLPIFLGLLLWDRLPETMATHFGTAGQADGWSSRAFAVFSTPLIILAAQWLIIGCSYLDPNHKNHNHKAFSVILWVLPLVSIFSSLTVYGTALELELSIAPMMFIMLGLIFIAIGNYLPKIKRNATLGIKIPWALANEENWNATHRFAGHLWVWGGIGIVVLSLVPISQSAVILILLMLGISLLPVGYSYWFYKKQLRQGIAVDLHSGPNPPLPKWARVLTSVVLAGICLLVCWAMFTGSIDYSFGETSFTVTPGRYPSISVSYDQITDLQLRAQDVDGSRSFGYGSLKLLLGNFENEEFGSYTRYTYYKPESCIVIWCGEQVLVLSGKDAQETQAIYETIQSHMP